MSDDLVFAPEADTDSASALPWKILIVDDEDEIHRVTRLALAGIRIENRPLQFLDAYTGTDSVKMMREHPDVAMVLMDVVMETESAGLDAVQQIREVLKNKLVRIVLRTGQPGQAPEQQVVTRYDINDYKEKTELTAKKLFTLVYTGLNLYGELCRMQQRQQSLEQVIAVSNTIFRRRAPERLCRGVLKRLAEMLDVAPIEDQGADCGGLAVAMIAGANSPVIAGTGCFTNNVGQLLGDTLAQDLIAAMGEIAASRSWSINDSALMAKVVTNDGIVTAFYLQHPDMKSTDPQVLDLFCENAAIALNNARMNQQVEHSQRELLLMLSEAIERRSRETGNHVRRVGELSKLLGQLSGLPAEESDMLAVAAPLHDAGKIAIPDAILNKPGKHTEEERVLMKTHAGLGGRMFENSELPALRAAAIIAHQHHERWDGQGYPNKLKGEDIHIYGRITALADVFDALCSSRCYKEPWPIEDVLESVRNEAGRSFDPKLVQLFLDNYDKVAEIRKRYPDS